MDTLTRQYVLPEILVVASGWYIGTKFSKQYMVAKKGLDLFMVLLPYLLSCRHKGDQFELNKIIDNVEKNFKIISKMTRWIGSFGG